MSETGFGFFKVLFKYSLSFCRRRLTYSQRKNYRASQQAVQRRQQKIKAVTSGAKTSADVRSDLRARPLSPGRRHDPDPFAALLRAKELAGEETETASLGRRAVVEFKRRQAAERAAAESLSAAASLPTDWDFAPADEPVPAQFDAQQLPAFQAAERSPRSLLTPADRMVRPSPLFLLLCVYCLTFALFAIRKFWRTRGVWKSNASSRSSKRVAVTSPHRRLRRPTLCDWWELRTVALLAMGDLSREGGERWCPRHLCRSPISAECSTVEGIAGEIVGVMSEHGAE